MSLETAFAARIGDAQRGVVFVRAVLGFKTLVTEIARGRNHHYAIVDQAFAFYADRRTSTGDIAHVMRYRQTEIDTMHADVAVTFVKVADELQRRDDGELGVFQRL